MTTGDLSSMQSTAPRTEHSDASADLCETPEGATGADGGVSTGDNAADLRAAVTAGDAAAAIQYFEMMSREERRQVLGADQALLGDFVRLAGPALGEAATSALVRELSDTLSAALRLAVEVGLTTPEALLGILNGAGVAAPDQLQVAQDDAMIALLAPHLVGYPVHQAFHLLAQDPALFILDGAGRAGAFADWLGDDVALLAQTVGALGHLDLWAAVMQTPHNAWDKLAALVRDPLSGGEAAWQAAVDEAVYAWFAGALQAKGGANDDEAAALYALYRPDRSLDSKRLTWEALYTLPLAAPNTPYTLRTDYVGTPIRFDDARLGSAGLALSADPGFVSHDVDLAFKVDSFEPSAETYDTFFAQFRQLPRAHINLAKALVFGRRTWVEWTYTVTATGAQTTYYEKDSYDKQLHTTLPPAQQEKGSLYWGSPIDTILINCTATGPDSSDPARNTGTAPTGTLADVDYTRADGTVGTLPWAANGRGADQVDASVVALNLLENHITHEVGHAVGCRNFQEHDATGAPVGALTSGNAFAQAYGDWKTHPADAATRDTFMTQMGWVPALDATLTYDIGGVDVDIPGSEVKDLFICAAEGRDSDAILAKATHGGTPRFGSVADAWIGVEVGPKDGSVDWTAYKFYDYLRHYTTGNAYNIEPGFADGGDRAYFWCTRSATDGWASYKRELYYKAISYYQISSVAECFAELYTDWFNGNRALPEVNGQSAVAFFTRLENAKPGDFQAAGTGDVAFGSGHGGAGSGFPAELEQPQPAAGGAAPADAPADPASLPRTAPAPVPATPLAGG